MNPGISLTGAVTELAVYLLIWGVLCWLRGRGTLMFIDQLANNSIQIVRPWSEFAALGNNLAVFLFAYATMAYIASVLIAGFGVFWAWADIHTGRFGPDSMFALEICVPIYIAWSLLSGFVGMMLDGIIAPAIYARRMTVAQVWPELWEEVVRPHLDKLIGFYLLMIAVWFGVMLVIFMAVCCTCCCAAIPYVGSVILLPLWAFVRLCGMYMLDQFGGKWIVFSRLEDPTCPGCHYNLRGCPTAESCPECGAILPVQAAPLPVNPEATPG